MRTDPFTRTPGVAGEAYIDMCYADTILQTFRSEGSAKYVYKIVGLRGSGKSVAYRRVVNTLSQEHGWLVYTLSAAGDPTSTLIAKLSDESFVNSKKSSTTVSAGGSAEANLLAVKGNADLAISRTFEEDPHFYSPEAALSKMIDKANANGYRVLVGIDDIAKTPEMVKFLSLWGAMLLDDRKKIYLVCTGLANNIEEFADESNLTFFKRSDYIEIGALDKFEIAAMYQKLLGVSEAEAIKMSKFTCGYAYAYQVLGSLYFNHMSPVDLQDLIPEFDRILFRDSYELIWNSLTRAEQEMVKRIVTAESGKASEIKAGMHTPSSYNTLRARLENKHLINTRARGYITIDLPRFKEYVLNWHQ